MTQVNATTKAKVKAWIEVIRTVADLIRHLGEVPSGVLYAQLMPVLDLEQYNNVISTLKRTGLVEEKSHLLTWVGPKEEPKQETTDGEQTEEPKPTTKDNRRARRRR